MLGITEKLSKTKNELLAQKRLLKNMIDDLAKEEPKNRLNKQSLFLKCSATNDELIKNLGNKAVEFEIRQKDKIAEVLEVKRFKEGLEKLRAEAKTQFIMEQEKIEQKDADERTTVMFARKKLVCR